MGNIFAISALRRKRGLLAGEIAAAETALARLRQQLLAVDTTLEIFDSTVDVAAIRAITPCPLRGLVFARGEQTRLVVDTLRVAGEAMAARDIVHAAAVAKGVDGDPGVMRVVTAQIGQCLQRLERRRVVVREFRGRGRWWRLAAP